MNAHDRWAAVWALFNSAHDMPPEQRIALLESKDLDPEIRDEVRALLETSASLTSQRSRPATPAPRPEYAAGHELGRYVILGLIGQGGFGRIYAAHDKELRRVVALKVLAGPLLGDRERLIEEARSASALNHPNIVTVYETILAGDHLAIVMEFVDGLSLRQILKQAGGALGLEKAARYGRQIAEALQAAHQAGITHRDIKPENILVRKDEYVKLVDFGLATSAGPAASQTTGGLTGTLRYISPEQLRGEGSFAASDVFSLGLVLYEMTTGMHPFRRESPLAAAEAIATAEPVPPSRKRHGIPAELDHLTMSMLAKDPAKRPPIAEVVRTLSGALRLDVPGSKTPSLPTLLQMNYSPACAEGTFATNQPTNSPVAQLSATGMASWFELLDTSVTLGDPNNPPPPGTNAIFATTGAERAYGDATPNAVASPAPSLPGLYSDFMGRSYSAVEHITPKVCPAMTISHVSDHTWVEFRLPIGSGDGQTVNFSHGHYNSPASPTCSNVWWTDTLYRCDSNQGKWVKVYGSDGSDPFCGSALPAPISPHMAYGHR